MRCPRERGHASRAKRIFHKPPVAFYATGTFVTDELTFDLPGACDRTRCLAWKNTGTLVTDERGFHQLKGTWKNSDSYAEVESHGARCEHSVRLPRAEASPVCSIRRYGTASVTD